VSYIYFLFFAVLIPLLGVNVKIRGSILGTIIFFAVRYLFGFGALTFGIPTACATLCWSVSTEKQTRYTNLFCGGINLLLPLSAMVLFYVHPVGKVAFVYSLYWLIPVVLYFFPRNIFNTALSSTFIAHSVGSVIWLYTMPSIPEKWIALLPIVAFERFLCAMVSVLAILLFSRVFSILKLYKNNNAFSFVRNYL